MGALLLVVAIAVAAGALLLGRGQHDGRPGRGSAPDLFEPAGITPLKPGTRGPAFRLRTLAGDGHRTLEDYADSLVLLNFWATWCGPCTAEMPTLEALWQRYRDRGFVVLAVSVDRVPPSPAIESYVRHHRLSFPVLLDPEMSAATAWRVTGIPATFIVRPGGEVAGVAQGARDWDGAPVRALLEALLPRSR